ncbi:MAG TPA: translocation/assembly module TamB domain-containing protein, partial [Flavitalea sp.]|nr:translocation/assembly module TamB domain-containing protein [Flavitalea sp.]
PDIDKTYIDFVAKDLRTTYADIVKLFPDLKSLKTPRIDLMSSIGFKGNFTGFVRDFVSFGRFQTPLGNFTTDLNMKIPAKGQASYSGNFTSDRFDIGKFLDVAEVGQIGIKGNITGSGMSLNTMNSKFDGDISFIEFNNYSYQGIKVKGAFAKKKFNGDLSIADPNLEVVLNGVIDLNNKIPDFDFTAQVAKADLRQLKLTSENIDFDGKFALDFTGSNVDNFLGTARVYDASVYRNGNRIAFDSLLVESRVNENQKVITAVSNEFDAALAGEFSILNLPNSFKKFLAKYYPSYIKPNKADVSHENFSFVITTKKVDDYLGLFQRDLSGMNNSTISGKINTKENLLDLDANIPQLYYGKINIMDLNIKAVGTNDSLSVESHIANLSVNDSMQFPGTHFTIRSSNDISEVALKTSGTQTINSANLAAQVQTLGSGVKILFHESSFDLNGKAWVIDKNGELVLSNQLVSADGIRLYNGQQEILVSTVPSDIGNTHDIRIDLTKLNLGDISPYLVKDMRIEGMMTGSINIIDPFGKFRIDAETDAELFRLDNDSIGKLNLNAHYNQQTGRLNLGARSDNENYKFDVDGVYKFKDSVSSDNLAVNINLADTKIDMLEKYLSGIFADLTGNATGNLRIEGTTKDLNYLGQVHLKDGGLRVKYTNVFYKIPSADFQFLEDRIDFGSFQMKDSLGNTATVSRGKLFHRNFDDLSFDFVMNTNKLLVLNTSNNGVDPYFGQVIARANMTFEGPLENMQMSITAEPTDSSSFFISNKSGKESGQADFVVWKVYGTEMQPAARTKGSNLTVDLDINANNFAKMYVIMDDLTGDVIKAVGSGNLQIHATTTGDLTINGRYNIDRGDYNFTFQSFLKKPFKLREGGGNYIVWDGDPINARMNINAEYEAENVQFKDLSSPIEQTTQNDQLRQFRGTVLVVAKLTGQLLSPDIKFNIELPQNSTLKNDRDAAMILETIVRDENELNKQVAFLIVFNSFAAMSSSTSSQNLGSTAFEGIVVNSISGMLSNTLTKQFSNIVQGIFNDKSLKVNFNAQLYNGSNYLSGISNTNGSSSSSGIDRTNLNFSVGKSLFNERLTFTFGSAFDFGLSSTQINEVGSIPFLPDITADWKIRPDGRLILSFFYRETYNYNYKPGSGTIENRSGASIGYRRGFDKLSELWRGNDKKKKEN